MNVILPWVEAFVTHTVLSTSGQDLFDCLKEKEIKMRQDNYLNQTSFCTGLNN